MERTALSLQTAIVETIHRASADAAAQLEQAIRPIVGDRYDETADALSDSTFSKTDPGTAAKPEVFVAGDGEAAKARNTQKTEFQDGLRALANTCLQLQDHLNQVADFFEGLWDILVDIVHEFVEGLIITSAARISVTLSRGLTGSTAKTTAKNQRNQEAMIAGSHDG